ncbi:MAG: molecular chaperone HtpG [Deltaproteobacteria bacterium]|nr:molecular chaperone HtpG [Deltaproteobacteria bacterium]
MSHVTETHRFEAETQKVLDLVVRSLYSDRQVFLRELVSNASDALDHARYLALHRPEIRPAEGDPAITLAVDPSAGTLTVSDNGVGLTREEAVSNLGTIARSGTQAFLAALEEKGVEGLIGQFGVGFYAVFMVADRVEVHSLSAEPDAAPVLWRAEGGDTFTVEPGTRTTRGTDVTVHLKPDAREFLDADRIRSIVRRWSDFLAFPVFLAGERINRASALWSRPPREVTDEEYVDFYKHVSGDWEEPLARVHFSSDAPMQFHALLFVPQHRTFDMETPEGRGGVRLYSRRVLVLEDARDVLPRYLRFLKGVIESDDLDLNVSREMLQKTPQVEALRRQVARRVLKRLAEVARDEPATWEKTWAAFGSILKEGIHEDPDNREAVAGLLRYPTSAGKGSRTLRQVLDEMPEGQNALWFLTGLDLGRLEKSPLLERFRRKGWEVLLMADPVDEWVVLHLGEYGGKPLKSAARGEIPGLEEPDDPIADLARQNAATLVEHLRTLLANDVADVRPSTRLSDSPSVLVDAEEGVGSNLSRILRAVRQEVPAIERVLEVNVEHPVVKHLARLYARKESATVDLMGRLLLDHARLVEGEIPDPGAMVDRFQALLLRVASEPPAGEDGPPAAGPPAEA